ncbi:MAG: hypothetical protein HKL90_00160 [Elusimicrobia bacterium]|nr:hypothetical protein [Elusimicrobiota bacterium]
MNCSSFVNVLDLYRENRLSPRRGAAARAHLAACAACRAVAAPLQAAPETASAALKRRLADALRAAAPADASPARTATPLWPRDARAVALAAAALALVGLLIAATGAPSQSSGGAATVAEEP